MPAIGFHTDAFNSSNWNFEQCVKWAKEHDLSFIECGTIDGVAYIQALGFYPHVSLTDDPALIRKMMDGYGVRFSQLDAAFPLNRTDGLTLGVHYICNSIRWAKLTGCPRVDTTDSGVKPEGQSDKEGMDLLKRAYREILKVAEAHEIKINLEPHGYFTTKIEFVSELLEEFKSPYFGINMDTGNTYISGRDPVEYVETFKDRINHVHVKDVSQALADALRGDITGIAMSQSAVGDGVNAENIQKCARILMDNGYDGVFSLECEGGVLEKSVEWMRSVIR
ncbi:MAG: sugar phosphate isomerase/epimerase family protein [Candidatus Hinthialibacter sp.]